MATLKQIYDELNTISSDIQEYIEIDANGNLSSDLTSNVENPLEVILVALETIIDDKAAGIYEGPTEDDSYEDFEDF